VKAGIISILLAIILALIPCLSALADDSGVITITMTGASEISIGLSQTEWPIGDVSFNTVYKTAPEKEWCTITNTGNVNVDIYVQGEDAEWTGGMYKWILSDDETNGGDPSSSTNHEYVLWYWIAYNSTEYTLITKEQSKFWPLPGGSSLPPGEEYAKQFGLKLLTPTFFYGGRQMQTQITISAVAA